VEGLLQEEEPSLPKRIGPYWQLPPDPLILDLGSGVRNFVVGCRHRGFRAFGVEPDGIGSGTTLTSLRIAAKRLDSGAFAAAVGEQLPFRDATFDLVVLEPGDRTCEPSKESSCRGASRGEAERRSLHRLPQLSALL
jgi:hypothetical protein